MARPRRSDEQKKLVGTYEHSRSEQRLWQGRTALTEPLPPPSDLDKGSQRHWTIHMQLLVARRVLSISDLPAFRAMVEASAAREKAYKIAMRKGPVSSTAAGGDKPSAAWQTYLATDTTYCKWTSLFGLNPKWAGSSPPLPVPERGMLREVR